jgi:hypothetical protein
MTRVKTLIIAAFCAAVSAVSISGASANATTLNCVDGSKRSNLSVTWNTAGNVTVGTVGNKPLCADTTLYFSSYTMPDNYNGGVFANNPTASPQTVFDSTSTILKKGQTAPVQLTIDLPEACKNIQVDVYYAPEITNVGPAGHGTQYITGKIIKKTVDTCEPTTPEVPEEPEVPVPEAQEPETPAPEVKVTPPAVPAAPAELPKTGPETALLGGVGITSLGYAGYTAFRSRRDLIAKMLNNR